MFLAASVCIFRVPENVFSLDPLFKGYWISLPGLFMRFSVVRVVHWLLVLLLYSTGSLMGADSVHFSIDASKPGAKIDFWRDDKSAEGGNFDRFCDRHGKYLCRTGYRYPQAHFRKSRGGKLALTVGPKSVTVISLEP